MLKILRHKNVSKVVLWIIAILILPAFVLWGTGAGGGGRDKGPKFAGLIDGKKVSFEEFGKCVIATRAQVMLSYFGQEKVLDAFLKERSFLGRLAWDRLIMLKEANKNGIRVSDAELVKFIKTHPLFSRNGIFDDRLYAYVLQHSFAIDRRNFEEITRDSLKIQKLNDMISKGLAVSDSEIAADYKKENEKFKLTYLLISSNDVPEKAKIDDKELKDYYDSHKNEFTIVPKDTSVKAEPKTMAFDEVKESLRSYLVEMKSRPLVGIKAGEVRKEIADIMAAEKLSFAAAAAKLGLKTQETVLFSIKDYLENIGEAEPIVNAVVDLKKGDVPAPIETRKGVLVFEISDLQPIDDAKFAKEKEEYSKRVLSKKKLRYLENWLRQLETRTKLNIDLADYEQYIYR